MKSAVDPHALARAIREYEPRRPILKELAGTLERHTGTLLQDTPRVDRVSFRAKDAKSFAWKSLATDPSGARKYQVPHADIEDQIAGRVLVFFRRDIQTVAQKLTESFNRVEQVRKAPREHDAFAYESEHFVFIIPPHVLPKGWADLGDPPTTFEMQVRTLFMHAWAEPQHDISYKSTVPLTDEEKRKLAWAASSAWGGDAIFEQVLDSIGQRVPQADDD